MDKMKLIEGLNRDLADELGTICRYIQQAAMATGMTGHEVREFVKAEVADEVNHALFLADKIVALGGTPAVKPAAFKELKDPTAMLKHDLELERQAMAGLDDQDLADVPVGVRPDELVAPGLVDPRRPLAHEPRTRRSPAAISASRASGEIASV